MNISAEYNKVNVGGIIGAQYGASNGYTRYSTNTGTIRYIAGGKNNDLLLDPRMGQIIGWMQAGTQSGNSSNGQIDIGNLNEWYSGFWPFGNTISQKDFIGGAVGKTGS